MSKNALCQADEDNPRGYFEFEKVKQLRTDKTWLLDAKGKAVKVIAQLLPFLPPKYSYQVIFMERNIHEVLASQRKMLSRKKKRGADLSDERLYQTFTKQVQQIKNRLSALSIPTLYVSHRDAIRSPKEVAASLNAFFWGHLNEEKMVLAVDRSLYRQKTDNE